MKKTNRDLFKDLVNEVIGLMQTEGLEWSKPFYTIKHQNPFSGSWYRGINPFILSLSARAQNFTAPYWATFNQLSKAGGRIKKGAKSTRVFFYTMVEKEDKKTKEKETFPVFKSYLVFNLDQIEGDIKLPKKAHIPENNLFSRVIVEHFLDNIPELEIDLSTDGAFYNINRDKVFMPHQSQFDSEESYYSTLLHELVHWTGAKSRLNREGVAKFQGFGTEGYAFEELIAEFGSVFLSSHLGVKKENLENHAAYLQHWVSILKDKPMMLWTAASRAQAAFDYLVEFQGSIDKERATA